MSECWNLDRKERNKPKSDMLIQKAEVVLPTDNSSQSKVPKYQPFISQGLVSLVG